MTLRPILIAAFVAFASPAFANQCPGLMTEIDAAMANASLTAEEQTQVETLRAEGEELHAAGDHAASIEKLNEAKALLGV